mgnify:FL=1|tara:strand:- start:416 stop:568 length:153 start_codon:yes stop_codon:yes gene_type:complete
MIKNIVDMLKLDDHFGISENVEIAKGKYKLESNVKKIYKQEKRKLYFKKK